MKCKVRLLSNYKEIEEYDAAIEQHGSFEEVFNLGLYTTPPKEMFVRSDFLFRVSDVMQSWLI